MCFATLSLMSAPCFPRQRHVKTGVRVALEEQPANCKETRVDPKTRAVPGGVREHCERGDEAISHSFPNVVLVALSCFRVLFKTHTHGNNGGLLAHRRQ